MREPEKKGHSGQSDQERHPRKVGFPGRVRLQSVEMWGWAGR